VLQQTAINDRRACVSHNHNLVVLDGHAIGAMNEGFAQIEREAIIQVMRVSVDTVKSV
tara:strand:- start:162 stop:335 length:174 start_codon:yes stop_codon:yes gene_type:complete